MEELKKLVDDIIEIIDRIKIDLNKSIFGNKASSQKVRVDSIKLERMLKKYRELSVLELKIGKYQSKALLKRLNENI